MGLSFVLILLFTNGSGVTTVKVGSYAHYGQCQDQGRIALAKVGWIGRDFICIPVNKK